MKVTELSRKAMEFQGRYGLCAQNGPGLPLATGPGGLIHVVEMDGWLQIMIEVDEDATHHSLRRVIPLALRWRDALLDYQGPWSRGGRNTLLMSLSDDVACGEGPAALARRINEKLASLLKEALAYEREAEAARPHLRTFDDWIGWRPKANPYAAICARDLLVGLGWSEPEAEATVREGVRRLRLGRRPFVGPYDPVSRARVERVVRTFRASLKGRAYVRMLPESLRKLYEKGGGKHGPGRRKAHAHPRRTRVRTAS